METIMKMEGLLSNASKTHVRVRLLTNGVDLYVGGPIKDASVELSIAEARHIARCLYRMARKASQAIEIARQ